MSQDEGSTRSADSPQTWSRSLAKAAGSAQRRALGGGAPPLLSHLHLAQSGLEKEGKARKGIRKVRIWRGGTEKKNCSDGEEGKTGGESNGQTLK